MPLASHPDSNPYPRLTTSVSAFNNGYPPPIPDIKSGEIRILPLRGEQQSRVRAAATHDRFRNGIAIPVRADAESEPVPPPSESAFLIREFASTLSRGTPGEIAVLSGYLLRRRE